MSAEAFVNMIEEMVDIKVRQNVELRLHVKPELARFMEEKRSDDRSRLKMIKQELARLLAGPAA
jgi:hypothetical protein